jgi:hypothetical protein
MLDCDWSSDVCSSDLLLADNFEGLAIERRDGQRILWVISDDNHLFFQRTLLIKFALSEKL